MLLPASIGLGVYLGNRKEKDVVVEQTGLSEQTKQLSASSAEDRERASRIASLKLKRHHLVQEREKLNEKLARLESRMA